MGSQKCQQPGLWLHLPMSVEILLYAAFTLAKCHRENVGNSDFGFICICQWKYYLKLHLRTQCGITKNVSNQDCGFMCLCQCKYCFMLHLHWQSAIVKMSGTATSALFAYVCVNTPQNYIYIRDMSSQKCQEQ